MAWANASSDEIREFRARVKASGIGPVVSHASYLINLATTNEALRRQSMEAMGDEIDRAEALGLLGVVLHPGCYTQGTKPTRRHSLPARCCSCCPSARGGARWSCSSRRPARGRRLAPDSNSWRRSSRKRRTIDGLACVLTPATCSPPGYDVRSPEGYAETFTQFGRLIGFARLKLFHLNDSKKPLGSRVDRHEHIGQGHLGLEPFRRLVNDPRFRDVPMLLETPKTEGRAPNVVAVDPLDERNLNTVRGLIAASSATGCENDGQRRDR